MRSEVRAVGSIRIMDWYGKITLGEDTIALRKELQDIMKNGVKNVILNLGHVDLIDSPGLGQLVSTYATVISNGGKIKLLNLNSRIKDLLIVTKLSTVFEVFDSEQEAIDSFN